MFTELHNRMDRDFREQDLAQRMAERRRLAAARRSSLRARTARMLFALAVAAQKHEAWRMARESSEAMGRT